MSKKKETESIKYIHYAAEDSIHSECGLWLMEDESEDDSECIRQVTCPKCLSIMVKIMVDNLAK